MVQESGPQLLDDLRDLVRVSEGGHSAVQAFVADRLRKAGAEVQVVDYQPSQISVSFETGAPAKHQNPAQYVIGSFGSGDDGLMYWAHSDSEPVDSTGWSKPLFDGVIEDGRMYGWGIGDDLVGIGAMLALARLTQHGLKLGSRRTILASTPSKQRAQAIIHALGSGITAAGTVYLHPAESGTGLGEIKSVASGLLRFSVRVHGRQPDTTEPGHTVFAHLAVDPVRLAATVVEKLYAFGEQRAQRVHYAPIHEAVGRSTNLHIPYVHAGDTGVLNKVPSYVDIYGAISFPPNESLSAVQTELTAELDRISTEHDWLRGHRLQPQWLLGIEAAEIPLDSDVYRLTHETILAVTGQEPIVNPLHAGSDIRNPWLHKGIPTVGIGPLVGGLTVSGGTDEWADTADYLRAVETICRMAHAWSQGGGQ